MGIRFLQKIFMIVLVLASVSLIEAAKDNIYESGQLLNVDLQEANREMLLSDGLAIPIHRHVYTFEIRVDGIVYFADYRAGNRNYKREFVVSDPIDIRFEKAGKMFLKCPDGKELEAIIVKKVRQERVVVAL